jgi:hypothetical protein
VPHAPGVQQRGDAQHRGQRRAFPARRSFRLVGAAVRFLAEAMGAGAPGGGAARRMAQPLMVRVPRVCP